MGRRGWPTACQGDHREQPWCPKRGACVQLTGSAKCHLRGASDGTRKPALSSLHESRLAGAASGLLARRGAWASLSQACCSTIGTMRWSTALVRWERVDCLSATAPSVQDVRTHARSRPSTRGLAASTRTSSLAVMEAASALGPGRLRYRTAFFAGPSGMMIAVPIDVGDRVSISGGYECEPQPLVVPGGSRAWVAGRRR